MTAEPSNSPWEVSHQSFLRERYTFLADQKTWLEPKLRRYWQQNPSLMLDLVGSKSMGGALNLEPGLQEKDFEELAREGVWIVREIDLGEVGRPEEANFTVKWAKKHGMVVMMHSGGTSIPGSSIITADQIIATDPHIVSHFNGGPTALFLEEASTLIEKTPCIIEITHCGNMKRAAKVMEVAKKTNIINRVIIGNDAPKAAEIVVALAVTDSGRPHPRIGGLGKEEAKKEDGLR